jgi:hypothetical protein
MTPLTEDVFQLQQVQSPQQQSSTARLSPMMINPNDSKSPRMLSPLHQGTIVIRLSPMASPPTPVTPVPIMESKNKFLVLQGRSGNASPVSPTRDNSTLGPNPYTPTTHSDIIDDDNDWLAASLRLRQSMESDHKHRIIPSSICPWRAPEFSSGEHSKPQVVNACRAMSRITVTALMTPTTARDTILNVVAAWRACWRYVSAGDDQTATILTDAIHGGIERMLWYGHVPALKVLLAAYRSWWNQIDQYQVAVPPAPSYSQQHVSAIMTERYDLWCRERFLVWSAVRGHIAIMRRLDVRACGGLFHICEKDTSYPDGGNGGNTGSGIDNEYGYNHDEIWSLAHVTTAMGHLECFKYLIDNTTKLAPTSPSSSIPTAPLTKGIVANDRLVPPPDGMLLHAPLRPTPSVLTDLGTALNVGESIHIPETILASPSRIAAQQQRMQMTGGTGGRYGFQFRIEPNVTPLSLACAYGHLSIVDWLVHHPMYGPVLDVDTAVSVVFYSRVLSDDQRITILRWLWSCPSSSWAFERHYRIYMAQQQQLSEVMKQTNNTNTSSDFLTVPLLLTVPSPKVSPSINQSFDCTRWLYRAFDLHRLAFLLPLGASKKKVSNGHHNNNGNDLKQPLSDHRIDNLSPSPSSASSLLLSPHQSSLASWYNNPLFDRQLVSMLFQFANWRIVPRVTAAPRARYVTRLDDYYL